MKDYLRMLAIFSQNGLVTFITDRMFVIEPRPSFALKYIIVEGLDKPMVGRNEWSEFGKR